MKRILLLVFAICLFGSTALDARAQASGPPKVLSIFREDIKAGRGAAHEKVEAGYVRASQKAKWPVYYIAMSSVYGGSDALFMTAYDSFAALQKDRESAEKNAPFTADNERMDALDAEFRTGQRSMICVLNEELSYGGPLDISQMRFFSVNTVRVRPGHDREYRDSRKMLLDALKKANSDSHSSVYSVSAGMPNGTYLVLTPRKSLAELDPNPAMAKAVQDAMDAAGNTNNRQKLLADSVISSETTIYAFSPRMSYVPKEWAKTGGEFWTPKPPPAPRPAVKKPAESEKPAEKK